MQAHGILCEEQHGFQTGESCDSQLIITINDFANCLNENKQIDTIFFDFSKAFDKVPHQRLFNKLSYYEIKGSTLAWIQNYLTNRYQRVTLEGICSSNFPVTSGVPQGTVLAPLLFLCFVNDIPASVQCKIRLYADDILLYSEISSINDCTRLPNDINYLFNWSETWLLQFNSAKCMHLRITNKHSYTKFTYCLDKSIIKEVPSANYLGITIDSKLTWSDHVTRVVTKANSVLGFLQRNLKYCPPEIKASCFKSLVIPILEYGCTSWFPRFQKDTYAIEMVQRRTARFIFNDYSYNTSVTSLLNTLNWPTLQNRRINLRAIMFYKIVNNLIGIPADSFLFISPLQHVITTIATAYHIPGSTPTYSPFSHSRLGFGTI